MKASIISISIIVLTAAFFLVDVATSNVKYKKAIVTDNSFSASNRSTTTGVVYTNNGVSPVVATSGHDDEWFLIVHCSDSSFIKVKCTISQYYNNRDGNIVIVKSFYGGFTGLHYTDEIK